MTDLISGETSSKSAQPAKDFESCETVSIAESAQCSLVQRLAQLLNHESTRMDTNRRCSGGCVSRKSLNLATSCHADSSRRSCRQTEALRVGGSQPKADCRAIRHRLVQRSTSSFRYKARSITVGAQSETNVKC